MEESKSFILLLFTPSQYKDEEEEEVRLLVEHGPVDNLMIKTQLRLCHMLALEIAYDELLETMGEL